MSIDLKPQIAVAIACYNQGRFLRDAIKSVLDQARPADDIVLVDDGSTDASAEIGRSFKQVRYHYQPNAGLSAARNTGLALTTADRILFLDADDLLRPCALAEAERSMASRAGLAFVWGGYVMVDSNRRILSHHPVRPTNNAFLDLLGGNFIAMHGTVLYDANLLRDAGGFDVTLPSCEDYDVYLRLARSHPVSTYDCVAAEYRRHGDGLSGGNFRMVATSRRVIQRHMRLAPQDQAHRASAEAGLSHMTTYYADTLVGALEQGFRQHRLRHVLTRAAVDACHHPGAIPHVAASLPRVVWSRWRRR